MEIWLVAIITMIFVIVFMEVQIEKDRQKYWDALVSQAIEENKPIVIIWL